MEISARKVAQVAVMARELGRAEGELRAFIDRMSEDEQAELVAVMWIGRESFSPRIGTRRWQPQRPRPRRPAPIT